MELQTSRGSLVRGTIKAALGLMVVFAMSGGAYAHGDKKGSKDDKWDHHDKDGKGKHGKRHRFLSGSLKICDQGSFFVGGVPKITKYSGSSTPATEWAQITVGQMYVQFQIPETSRKWPIIYVHGSSHTGACIESTVDGKEGWAPFSVRNKLATYVVDQPGRGRSGADQSRIHEAIATLRGTAGADATPVNFSRIADSFAWNAWWGHTVQPGTNVDCGSQASSNVPIESCELVPHGWRPDDPSPTTVHPQPANYLPAWRLDATADPIYPDSLDYTGTGTWGPPPYGPESAYKLHYYRQLVPNFESTLPRSTCASCTPTSLSPDNTWSPRNVAALVKKLGGAIVVVHSQSGFQGLHMMRVLRDSGDLKLLKGLISYEGDCNLPTAGLNVEDFDKVPFLAIKGDYRNSLDPRQVICKATADAIHARRAARQGSARADYVELDDPKFKGRFKGVTHMAMVGPNANDVLSLVFDWAAKHIDNPVASGVCNSPPAPTQAALR